MHNDLPIRLQRVGYREKGTQYHYGPHRHDIYQWYCVLYGVVDMAIEQEHHLLRAEECILIPPGATRSPRSVERAPGYLWAHFANLRLDLEPITGCVLAIPMELRGDLLALVSETQNPVDSQADDLIAILLSRILIGLRRGCAGGGAAAGQRSSSLHAAYQTEIVQRVESYVRNNLGRPLARADLARVVRLSPAHLARIVQRVRHKTLNELVTATRLEYSKKLLLESTLSISQICMSVGYRSFSHFSTLFRRYVGIPPSDYRQSGGRTWRKEFS